MLTILLCPFFRSREASSAYNCCISFSITSLNLLFLCLLSVYAMSKQLQNYLVWSKLCSCCIPSRLATSISGFHRCPAAPRFGRFYYCGRTMGLCCFPLPPRSYRYGCTRVRYIGRARGNQNESTLKTDKLLFNKICKSHNRYLLTILTLLLLIDSIC